MDSKKHLIINEPAKERQTVTEVRTTLGITSKLNNLMIVPFGRNQGKSGGALILVLINKYSIGDDDKQKFE